jgi:hypothetical protein
MSNTNTGGPAFPGLHPSAECRFQDEGMTLRDYFAAKAMQSALANATLPPESWPQTLPLIAVFSYAMADAMLEAREA